MLTMAEAVQAMQSMVMSNASAGLAARGPVVLERPKKQSERESLTELGDSEGIWSMGGNMSETPGFPTLLSGRAGKHSTPVLMMWHPEGGGTMRNA